MKILLLLTVLTISLLSHGMVHAIEKPDFKLLKKDGKFELRQYSELHIVTATMEEESQRNQAFRKLAGYIGKKNEKGQKIAMTSPVLIDGAKVTERESTLKPSMSFVVPKNVVEGGIPKPNDPSISLSKIEGGKFAVKAFKNSNSDKSRKEALEELRVWIGKQKLQAIGEASFAFYDPPWIPQMFRTNEVWIRVEKVE
ncbi:SOUL family heme-binding protein [Rubritalea spongiae]|uniref:SOUL family heme-binding protein n=1 Tax=Rubritalea spongiae TaxID=430797 RepID=A0ABW5E4L3_9BACT